MAPLILCSVSFPLLLFSFFTEDWLNFLNTNQITHHLKFLTKPSLLFKDDLSPSFMSHGFLLKQYPDWPLEVWSSFKYHLSLSPAPPPLCAELTPPVCSSQRVLQLFVFPTPNLTHLSIFIMTISHRSLLSLAKKKLNKYWLIKGRMALHGLMYNFEFSILVPLGTIGIFSQVPYSIAKTLQHF